MLDDDMLIRKDGIDALTDKCVKQVTGVITVFDYKVLSSPALFYKVMLKKPHKPVQYIELLLAVS